MRAKKRPRKPINYDIGPAYSATSKDRAIADKKYEAKAAGSGLKSKLYQNPDGTYTRKSVDSSPAEYKDGGVVKKKREVRKGSWDVEVDGREYSVEGKRTVRKDGSVIFKGKGTGRNNPVKRVKDKTIKDKTTGLVKKYSKKTTYR